MAVDLIETESAKVPSRVGTFVLKLHGAIFPFGQVLKGALGVGLVFQGTLLPAPVDGPELDHLGKEGNDFLKHHNGFDRGFPVLGSFPG